MGDTSRSSRLENNFISSISPYPLGLLRPSFPVVDPCIASVPLLLHLQSSPFQLPLGCLLSSEYWSALPLSSQQAADDLVSRWTEKTSATKRSSTGCHCCQAEFFLPYHNVNVFYTFINMTIFLFHEETHHIPFFHRTWVVCGLSPVVISGLSWTHSSKLLFPSSYWACSYGWSQWSSLSVKFTFKWLIAFPRCLVLFTWLLRWSSLVFSCLEDCLLLVDFPFALWPHHVVVHLDSILCSFYVTGSSLWVFCRCHLIYINPSPFSWMWGSCLWLFYIPSGCLAQRQLN